MSLVPLPRQTQSFQSLKELNAHKKQFQWYLTANELGGKSEDVRVAHLRCALTDQMNEIVDKLNEALTVDKIYDHIKGELLPKDNTCFNQFCFFNLTQKEGQPFNDYYLQLDSLGQQCNLGDKYDEVLKARLVCGLWDIGLKERLMRSPDMILKDMVNYCRVAEDAKNKTDKMVLSDKETGHTVEVHAFKPYKRQQQTWQTASVHANKTGKSFVQTEQPHGKSWSFNCNRCRTRHLPRQCPAYNKLCTNCHKPNHFSVSCRYNKRQFNRKPQVHGLECADESLESDSNQSEWSGEMVSVLSLGSIGGWMQKFTIGGAEIDFKLDTGADINVIPESVAVKINSNWKKMSSKNVPLIKAFGGHKIYTLGNVQIRLKKKELCQTLVFSVVKNGKGIIPILGRDACVTLGFIKKVETLDHVFELDENKSPTCKPPQRGKGRKKKRERESEKVRWRLSVRD
uniref:Peptidase A2 domain-containing protein n=1 Tax=Cacopsylla melanoneura TaxID=428564 RepID=A0A8D8TR55_9HEMI